MSHSALLSGIEELLFGFFLLCAVLFFIIFFFFLYLLLIFFIGRSAFFACGEIENSFVVK